MSDIPEFTCPQCGATCLENQLRMQRFTREACPSCDFEIKKSERWGSTNVELLTASDIQAIDTWLDNHVQSTGKKLVQRNALKDKGQWLWSLETAYPFPCEVSYDSKHPNLVVFRFVFTEHVDTIFGNLSKLQTICASHGLEPYGVQQSDVDFMDSSGTTVSAAWGAQQHISVDVLCEEWFEPLFRRLQAAMKDAIQSIAE